MIDDSALGSHFSIPAKCSSLHDVCFILAAFHLQKNQAIRWKQKEDLFGMLPKCKTRVLIEAIFLPGVRDGMCLWVQEQIYVCSYGRGTLSCVALGQYVHCKPRDTRECPTLSIMPVWLGQPPTPGHRSDCFRIRYVSKMSLTTSASPLCQGSCDSISQNEENKLFVKGKIINPECSCASPIVCRVSESQNWVIVWEPQL